MSGIAMFEGPQSQSNLQVIIRSNTIELKELANKLVFLKVDIQVNSIPSATLDFAIPYTVNTELEQIADVSICQLGTLLTIECLDNRQRKILFNGIVTDRSFTIQNNHVIFSLTLKHNIVKLTSMIRSQVFLDMSASDIINKLCLGSGSTVSNDMVSSERHEQRVQFRCSDWQMLRHCLDVNSAWLIAEVNGIRILEPKLSLSPDHVLQAKDGLLMEKAKWQFSLLEQPNNIKVTAWDIDSQTLISALGQHKDLVSGGLAEGKGNKLKDDHWVIGLGTSPSKNSLGNHANGLLLKYQLGYLRGEFTMQGSMAYQLGQTLKLSGFGKGVDGSGIITGLVHVITPSKWSTSVKMGGHGVTPTMSTLPSVNGIQPGIVASYARPDPKDRFRIKVHLPILGSEKDNSYIWARFAMPYASQDGSFICYPEEGDEVIVSFYENNPDYAVIIGALHNPKNPPIVNPGEDRGMKGWETKKAKLQVNTQENSIHIHAGDKSAISMDPSNPVKIDSDNGVSIKGKSGVTIKGDKIDLIK
ncbi:TPA: hypothetical protein SIA35_004278 [Aeromonas sobria]|nr:hypothetical protein [Aeromonas sobria]